MDCQRVGRGLQAHGPSVSMNAKRSVARSEREQLAHSAHEVRNALCAITFCLANCESGDEEQKTSPAHVRMLKGQLERIGWAIEDVETVAAGNLVRPVVSSAEQPVSLDRLIERRVSAWERVAQASNV